jgi:hypothetical protein
VSKQTSQNKEQELKENRANQGAHDIGEVVGDTVGGANALAHDNLASALAHDNLANAVTCHCTTTTFIWQDHSRKATLIQQQRDNAESERQRQQTADWWTGR